MNDNLIPLVTVAAEIGTDADELARQLGNDLQVDDIGIRCVTRSTARELFEDRDAHRAEQQRRHAEFKQRMVELDARNKAELRGGVPATPGSTAYADKMSGGRR